MMLIYEKRERAKEGEDSVNRGFFFFNALSDDNVLILKSTNLQRCFSFWKKLICVSFEA